ncbi:PulJ/GspJ family protein [Limisphaera sp. 4302-co]|uniref:PulJ/GspJ family protein n=1 Tax=Limisphaera sp. 4302-co TaxID=3400417 RepID=UPI003C22ED57
MKRPPSNLPRTHAPQGAAYTLPEVMVTSALLTLVIAGLISFHLLGLRLDRIGRAKLGATDEARRSLSLLEKEVREAGWVQVGWGDESTFVPVSPGQPQTGNALQIYTDKADTNRFVRYFLDAANQQLVRFDPENGVHQTLARFVTNQLAFVAEDLSGTVQTNPYNNRVIALTLQFNQLLFPSMAVGPGGLYDFYQVRTRITRRALE